MQILTLTCSYISTFQSCHTRLLHCQLRQAENNYTRNYQLTLHTLVYKHLPAQCQRGRKPSGGGKQRQRWPLSSSRLRRHPGEPWGHRQPAGGRPHQGRPSAAWSTPGCLACMRQIGRAHRFVSAPSALYWAMRRLANSGTCCAARSAPQARCAPRARS